MTVHRIDKDVSQFVRETCIEHLNMSAIAKVVVEAIAVDFCPRQLVAQRVIHENKFSARTLPAVRPCAGLILFAARVHVLYVCVVCTSYVFPRINPETIFVIEG